MKNYKEIRKKYESDDNFRGEAKIKAGKLLGEFDGNDPDVLTHLKIFRAELVATLIMNYKSMGIVVPIDFITSLGLGMTGLPPITKDEIICALVALQEEGEAKDLKKL